MPSPYILTPPAQGPARSSGAAPGPKAPTPEPTLLGGIGAPST